MATVVATGETGFRRCPHCEKEKALTDVHWYKDKNSRDGFQGWCRKCMNSMPKPHTTTRMCRNRARHRAMELLKKAHAEEFADLYDNEYAEAIEEALRLAADPANAHFEGSVVRLRKGPRRRLEDDGEVREVAVQERVDQEWCAQCSMFHARDHHLTARQIREAGLAESFESYNAGVERAQAHARRA